MWSFFEWSSPLSFRFFPDFFLSFFPFSFSIILIVSDFLIFLIFFSIFFFFFISICYSFRFKKKTIFFSIFRLCVRFIVWCGEVTPPLYQFVFSIGHDFFCFHYACIVADFYKFRRKTSKKLFLVTIIANFPCIYLLIFQKPRGSSCLYQIDILIGSVPLIVGFSWVVD